MFSERLPELWAEFVHTVSTRFGQWTRTASILLWREQNERLMWEDTFCRYCLPLSPGCYLKVGWICFVNVTPVCLNGWEDTSSMTWWIGDIQFNMLKLCSTFIAITLSIKCSVYVAWKSGLIWLFCSKWLTGQMSKNLGIVWNDVYSLQIGYLLCSRHVNSSGLHLGYTIAYELQYFWCHLFLLCHLFSSRYYLSSC